MYNEEQMLTGKRKLTSVWGVFLFIIFTSTYCYFAYKCIVGSLKTQFKDTGAIELYYRNVPFPTAITKNTGSESVLSDMNIREKELIFLDVFTSIAGTYVLVAVSFMILYLFFKEGFLHIIPQGCFIYLIFLSIANNMTFSKFGILLVVVLFITLMFIEQNEHNVRKMITLFDSYIQLLCKYSLIILFLVIVNFVFIIFQIYLIANVHNYMPNIGLFAYVALIYFFIVYTLSCFFFLSSFATSLSFYTMLNPEDCFTALLNAISNVFYLSGEICVYSIDHYRLETTTRLDCLLTICTNSNIRFTEKIIICIYSALAMIFAPFVKLFFVEGWHTITYITLTGRSYLYSYRKVAQMITRVDLFPYFGSYCEYAFYGKSLILIGLFRNEIIIDYLKILLHLSLGDTIMFYAATTVIILFISFFLNSLYSSVIFLFILCGDAMKISHPKLYKYFNNRREDFVIAEAAWAVDGPEIEEEQAGE